MYVCENHFHEAQNGLAKLFNQYNHTLLMSGSIHACVHALHCLVKCGKLSTVKMHNSPFLSIYGLLIQLHFSSSQSLETFSKSLLWDIKDLTPEISLG